MQKAYSKNAKGGVQQQRQKSKLRNAESGN